MNTLVGKKAPSFQAEAVINGTEFVEQFSLDQILLVKRMSSSFFIL
jgi:peroxiredoxin (alkyl hydroperoxide reductase subunit C)